MLELRPYQLAAVEKFLSRPGPRRLFLAHKMRGGKTYTSMGVLRQVMPERALFIVPAMVRPTWTRLLTEHFPERTVAAIIEGRMADGSKPALARRAAAYAAQWQVTSYDLAGEVAAEGWDFILFDEVHNLRSPKSQQTKRARVLLWANPEVEALGLSGTLIPNEAKQLWPPLDAFFPGEWGAPKPKTGDGSWQFEGKYCIKEVTAHGTIYRGLRPDKAQQLRTDLAPYVHEATEADFAQYIPRLSIEPLYVTKQPRDKAKFALEWVRDVVTPDVSFGVFTHLRETAHEIAAAMANKFPKVPVYLFTGADSPEKRDKLLVASRTGRAIIVGTTHSLREGISLEHLPHALVLEWVTELVQVLQFLPRFTPTSGDPSAIPPRVDFVIGPNDESRLAVLRERVGAANAVFTVGRAEAALEALSAPKGMSDAEFEAELDAMAKRIEKRAVRRGLIEVEEDDESDD